MDITIFVSGFSTEAERDRFVKAEIRYLKSFDMSAARCAGGALRFVLSGFERAEEYVAMLAREYPRLRVVSCPGADARTCADLATLRVEEILYETFT